MAHRRRQPPRRRPEGRRWSRRHVIWLAFLLAGGLAALLARPGYATWAKRMAIARMRTGAISDARCYLRRAAWCAPNDGTIDMGLAFCFRQLRQVDGWKDALRAARQKGVSRAEIKRETQLYQILSGDWYEGAESQLTEFAGTGLTTYDVPAAFVSGALVQGRIAFAKQILDAWKADFPDDPHLAYMWGKYWETSGDPTQTQTRYEAAILLEPRHELARNALAKIFEQDDQLVQAFRQYAELAAASPDSEVAALGAARILRKMDEPDRAQAVLEPFARAVEISKNVTVEMGRIAMDRGDFSDAERRFEQAGLDQTRDPEFLISAVRLLGMQGKSLEAERLFRRVAALGDRVTRIDDLRTKLKLDPSDAAIAAEIQGLYDGLDARLTSLEIAPVKATAEGSPPGRHLFALHCSVCHGTEGDGNGLASRHLLPRPRDIRGEPSRLVSTQNGAPSLDDTIAVLRRGIPGTSMTAYDNLKEEELLLLAEEVHRLRREGLPEQFVKTLERQGEDLTEDDLEEVQEAVAIMTSPGAPIAVPAIDTVTPASLGRGQETYLQLGCATCHGEDGAGAPDQMWHDEQGFPVRPRDLAREPFKGGRDPASVYLRIAAGMPGTPHPSCTDVSAQKLAEVVQFCLSLAREPEIILTDHQRAALATTNAYRAALDDLLP